MSYHVDSTIQEKSPNETYSALVLTNLARTRKQKRRKTRFDTHLPSAFQKRNDRNEKDKERTKHTGEEKGRERRTQAKRSSRKL